MLSEIEFYAENINDYSSVYDSSEEEYDSDDDGYKQAELEETRRGVKRQEPKKFRIRRPIMTPLRGQSRARTLHPNVLSVIQKISDTYGYSVALMGNYYRHAYAVVNKQRKRENLPKIVVNAGEFLAGFRSFINQKIDLEKATPSELASIKVKPVHEPKTKSRAPRIVFDACPPQTRDDFVGVSLNMIIAGKTFPGWFWIPPNATAMNLLKQVRYQLTVLGTTPLNFSITLGGKKLEDLTQPTFLDLLETYGSIRVTPLLLGGMPKNKNFGVPDQKKKSQKKKKGPALMTKVSRGVKAMVRRVPAEIKPNLDCLSSCAKKLMMAISDPFNPAAQGACGLVGNTQGSHKVTIYGSIPSLGSFTNATAFVNVAPCICQDLPTFYVTGTTYNTLTNTICTATNTYATGITAQAIPLPYSASQVANGLSNGATSLQGRVLSMGVRVFYTGTELNMGGIFTSVHRTNHENTSVVGGSTGSAPTAGDIQNWSGTRNSRVTKEPVEVTIFPVCTAEQNYTSNVLDTNSELCYPFSRGETEINGFTNTIGSVATGIPIAVIACAPPVGVGATLLVEYVMHVEYVGSVARASLTPSEADPVGHEIVMNAAARLGEAMRTKPGLNMGRVMRDLAVEAISHVTVIPQKYVRSGFRIAGI